MKLLIEQGRVIDPASGRDEVADIAIAAGRIVAIGKAPGSFTPDRRLNAAGCIVAPGLIDLCARLGEPGNEHARMLESEVGAAIAGGVTSLVCPPDTDPVLDEPGLVEMLKIRAERLHQSRVLPLGALTRGLAGEQLTEMAELTEAGCIAFGQADAPLINTQVLHRALQYASFNLICRYDEQATIEQVFEHYDEMARKNMTHEWGILSAINHNPDDKRNQLLARFAAKFADQPLVMDKYFSLIASSRRSDTLAQVQAALHHPQFALTNPNKVRALIGTFARNTPHFHAADGSGYAFVAQKICEINAFNPQIAAGLARAFNLMKRLEPHRQSLMRNELAKLAAMDSLSKDVREIVEKILG